ncbi:MAG: hopanoid biosynthesis-associated protein HpnK [Acetobacteraceae bacterium]|nr:hopanoid biosynthesis-associated protein HpnK [Acetobacteraceae bacterium]
MPPDRAVSRRVIFTADDFGLSEAVNEGIERAHREGVLNAASLMVGAPAAADAVERAKRLPNLRVGLHLVVIEGPAVLPYEAIPDLVDESGQFPSDQLRLGLRYFFSSTVHAQLRAEIRAQFAAFAATGLTLAHADAHKHMHLHPTVADLMIDAGWQYRLPGLRIPSEPGDVMRRCGENPGFGAWAMRQWTRVLRHKARAAGLATNDSVFGLAWTGAMTEDKLLRLAPALPEGLSEIYFHPASQRDATIDRLMPSYLHEAELAALCSPKVRAAFAEIA